MEKTGVTKRSIEERLQLHHCHTKIPKSLSMSASVRPKPLFWFRSDTDTETQIDSYRVFHSEMHETKALDGHLKLNFHP